MRQRSYRIMYVYTGQVSRNEILVVQMIVADYADSCGKRPVIASCDHKCLYLLFQALVFVVNVIGSELLIRYVL